MDLSRRHWMIASLGLAYVPEIIAAQAFSYLDASTAAEIEAMISQIVPSDESPGAHEAGVIYFIDCALSTFDKDKRDAYRIGLAETQAKRKALFPGSGSIAKLSSSQQIALLRSIEQTEFFELLRVHTMLGFLGAPSYGGNRDGAGWKLIGFEDRMSFKPPFGYYDSDPV